MTEITHILGTPHEIVNSVIVAYDAKETPEQKALRIAQGKPQPVVSYRASNVRPVK